MRYSEHADDSGKLVTVAKFVKSDRYRAFAIAAKIAAKKYQAAQAAGPVTLPETTICKSWEQAKSMAAKLVAAELVAEFNAAMPVPRPPQSSAMRTADKYAAMASMPARIRYSKAAAEMVNKATAAGRKMTFEEALTLVRGF